MASICLASLRHSFFASGSSHFGQAGAFLLGFGSLVFSGCLPGLPSSSFMAVGFGFLPLVAIGFPSLLQKWAKKKPGCISTPRLQRYPNFRFLPEVQSA